MAEPEDEICGRLLLDVLDQNVNSEKIINWLQNNDPNELFKNCSRSAFIRWYMRWIREQCEPLFSPNTPAEVPAVQPADPRQAPNYENNFPSLSSAPKAPGNPKQNRRIHPVLVTPAASTNNIQSAPIEAKPNISNNAPTIQPVENKNQRRISSGSDQPNVWAMNKPQNNNSTSNNTKNNNTSNNATNSGNNNTKLDLNNFPEVNRAQNSYKQKTKAHRAKPQHIANNNTNNNATINNQQQLEPKNIPKENNSQNLNSASGAKNGSGSETNSLRGSQEINTEMSAVSLTMAEKFLNIIWCKKELDSLSSVLATIFNGNLSLNLAHDLEFLMKIFSLKINWDEEQSTKKSISKIINENDNRKKFEELAKEFEFFKSNNSAIYFACKVVVQSISIIKNFGTSNLQLLTSNPILHVIGYEFVEQLNDIKHQNVAHVPSTDAAKPDPDFAIPLRLESETTKNMLKTNAERNVFNNREKCRDNFPKLLQELMSDPDYKNNVQSKMKEFLKQLLPQNYPFFASLFLAELLKNALNADEFDKQLAELTDPTKLRKLNQRMTERRADNSQNYSANKKGNNFNSKPAPQQYKHKGITYFNSNTNNSSNKAGYRPRPDKEVMEKDPFEGLFVDKEEKFFQMLYSVNNYCLNMNIIAQMRNKILELSNFNNTELVEDRFAERILKLKVLSKFLSFLLHWPTVVSYNLDSATLMPMGDALRSANRTDSSFDILLCLKQAQATSSLTLNLPWIIEHVKIMKLDKLTSETEHFKRIVNTLKFVYNSTPLVPKNESFNINSLFILNELEKCFEYLQTDPSEIDWNLITSNTSGDKSTSPFKNFIYSPVKKQTNVDSRSDLLNQNFIYLCFPYLDEFSSLLKEFNSQFFSTTPRQQQIRSGFASKLPSVKKITPVQPQNIKKSEQLLHHWFFWQHPTLSSLSDVVSKRVLSYYQSEILDQIVNLLDDIDITAQYTPTKSLLLESDGRLEQLVAKVIQAGCNKIKAQIPAKISDAMRCLADYNTDGRVLEAAIKLTIEHVTLTLPEFIVDNVRSRIRKILEERMNKKQKSPAKLPTQPNIKRVLPTNSSPNNSNTSPNNQTDIGVRINNITSPTKFSSEIQIQNEGAKENQNYGFNLELIDANLTEEEKEEERIRQLNKIKLKKASRMNNNLIGLISKLGDISEKYLTIFKHFNSAENNGNDLFTEQDDFNTFLHSFFNEFQSTCLIWGSRVLQLHVPDVHERDPLFASLKNVEALTVAFEQWLDIGFYALALCPCELTLHVIGQFQLNLEQIRTEHIEIEYESVPQKTEVICLFVKLLAELGQRDHRLTYLVPSYLLNHERINTLVQHNIQGKQNYWHSSINTTMICLMQHNLLNSLCIEDAFLESLNSVPYQNTAYHQAIEALIASFLNIQGPSLFLRLRAEFTALSKSRSIQKL